jgi:hypothetical protein
MIYARKEATEIVCLDLDGNLIGEYLSAKEAKKALELKYASSITECLYGKSMSVQSKYYFIEKSKYDPTVNYSLKHRKFTKDKRMTTSPKPHKP